ncbi:EscU/YscU/HrcU family type III secretion system export apparatus switch protein [Tenuibacillus multivorans]|uniref:Flagellar biosynthesis protein n=1 Tax=Tenuibacillus multivorans TaxID=237069 RepID=A0A1G9Y1B9_9BACI|nr:EscU/YscU/HrcU family type III secretion system export apparatus switch protein [Tenuibacillus multivorans]GEL75893.1 flagellar biosynthetic protein FlhB [Tenuibacillus multivorans]SDN02441.1 flagellar biosynthesis protein [Tenuibacillus multivorans]
MKRFEKQRKEVIALGYNSQDDEAPKVVAKGKGLIAEEILEIADQADVPIYEDETLMQLMDEININEKIPEDLYQAVAEVFAFIYQTDKKYE